MLIPKMAMLLMEGLIRLVMLLEFGSKRFPKCGKIYIGLIQQLVLTPCDYGDFIYSVPLLIFLAVLPGNTVLLIW